MESDDREKEKMVMIMKSPEQMIHSVSPYFFSFLPPLPPVPALLLLFLLLLPLSLPFCLSTMLCCFHLHSSLIRLVLLRGNLHS